MSLETKRRNSAYITLTLGTITALISFAKAMHYTSVKNEAMAQNWTFVFMFGALVYAFSLATLFDLQNKK